MHRRSKTIVTYAAIAWLPRIKFRTRKVELSKLHGPLGVTGAMRTDPKVAVEVLLGLPPMHLQFEAEPRTGIYRLYCSDQWKTKFGGFGHTYTT
jgi:hypothetical protein